MVRRVEEDQRRLRASSPSASLRLGIGYFSLGGIALVAWGQTPDPYIATQLAYSYAIGFMPRGLWGSLADLVGLMPGAVTATGLVGYLVLVATTSWVAARATMHDATWATARTVVVVGLLLSPAGFPFLAANLGRLDAPMLLFGGLSILAVSTRWSLGSHLATALLVAAVLTHEAALLAVTPLAAAWTWKLRDPRTAAALAAAAVAATAVIAVVPMPLPLDDFGWWLGKRVGSPDPFATILPYQGLAEALERGLRHLRHVSAVDVIHHVALPVVPVVALCGVAWHQGGLRRRAFSSHERAMVGATVAPLLLALVGTDLGRWVAIAVMQVGVVTIALTPRQAPSSPELVGLALLTVTTTILLGPMTI